MPDRYLATIEHEQVLVRRGTRSGLYCIVAVHSTVRGPAVGGCRIWRYDDPPAALRDALRLSKAMSYKSAVAGLRMGGGKAVIALQGDAPLRGRERSAALLDVGDAIEALAGAYKTAEDVGTGMRDMAVIARATPHVTGLARARGGSGDPSPATARGVEASVLATCERRFGSTSLRGRSIAIIGVGHVGLRLAHRLARRGARLVLADIDPAKRIEAGRLRARWMRPVRALTAAVDLVAPCALGGVFDHRIVPELQTPAIAGAANNQLADESVAAQLAARDILWAPDFVANAGGIVNISVELEPGGYDPVHARQLVSRIGDTLRTIYDDTRPGTSPLIAALALAERNLAR